MKRLTLKTLEGGTKVGGGFYFEKKSWELVVVSGKEGVLPGTEKNAYVKVPTVLLLAGAPLYSGAYVLFLPFIGFALLFREMARKAKEAGTRAVVREATVTPKAR
jgi:hypothetical protein